MPARRNSRGVLLGDRLGRRAVLIGCVTIAGVVTLATPLADSLLELAAVRAVVGLLLGMAAPCLLALVSGQASDATRGLALTATLSANSIGAASGSVFAMSIGQAVDWGHGFTLSGVLLLAMVTPLLIWAPRDSVGHADSAAERPSLTRTFWWSAAAIGACFFISMGLIATLSSWQASYFHHFAAVPVQKFAQVGLLSAPASILGMMLMGAAATRVSRKLIIVLTFATHAVALFFVGRLAFGTPMFVAVFFASVIAQAAGQGLLNITVAERCPSALRASAFGCVAAIGRVGGIAAPLLAAQLLDVHLSLSGVFALLAVAPLVVGAVLLILGLRRWATPLSSVASRL